MADIARLEGVSPEQAVERAAHLQPTTDDDDDAAGDLAFAEFDIVGVLERAAPLLAAALLGLVVRTALHLGRARLCFKRSVPGPH